ncbi:hypothetical protein MKY37_16550 [Psychrobacillus sp. FSL K6-2836]|uniref:hypothetical protein n=1 Tax=Psychrobacillus sp. FSL K6-2836 TaxID=2921548 RepID=UPI0030F94894
MASNTGENRGVMADTINGPVTFIYDSREKKVPTLLPKLIAALAKMDFKQKKDFRKIEKNNAYTIEDKIDHNQVDSYEEVIRKVYPSPQYPPQGFSSGCSSLLNSLFIWSKLI